MEHGAQAYAGFWYISIHSLKILPQIFGKGMVFCCKFVAERPDIRGLLRKLSRGFFPLLKL